MKNVPGRPKTHKLDAVWLAKLTEKGLLRPSFVPPAEIRRLRDYTRLREDLTHERTRYWQRLEKLLEDALIKVSVVASPLDTMSTRDMIEALIAGERDPRRLAELARGKMKAKRSELITALDGRFDDHHAELARMLLAQIDALSAQINTLTGRIEELIAELPEAAAVDPWWRRRHRHRRRRGCGHRRRAAIPGPAPAARRVGSILPLRPSARAECHRAPRRDHRRRRTQRASDHRRDRAGHDPFPHARAPGGVGQAVPAHHPVLALHPRRPTGKGNPYLKGALGQAAAAAAKTDTFLGQRYRRIVKRRGKLKALVAVARSILVIVWHPLADPLARFHDLGPDYHTHRINIERRMRNHIAQLTALGYRVTLEPAA